MKYYIWSIEHNAWWRPNSQGYSSLITEAGVYDQDTAFQIVSSANIALEYNNGAKPKEALVPRNE